MSDEGKLGVGVVVIILLLGSLVGGGCYLVPQYNIYQQKMAGMARLRESESSKQISIEDAKAKLESAKLLGQAEVERAKGVAEANKIIGESLKNNDGYLQYLWIQNLSEQGDKGSQIIYVPTEAGLPILESTRLNGGQ